MANTNSAKKATRVSARRTEINKNRVSRMRTFVRKVEEAIASGNQAEAAAALCGCSGGGGIGIAARTSCAGCSGSGCSR